MTQQPTQAPAAQQQTVPGVFQQLSGQNQEAIMMMQQRQAQSFNRGPQNNDTQREPKVRPPSIYIGNLPEDYYQLDLFKHVKSLGFNIKTALIGVDQKTKRQNRYGFLHFYDETEASRCAAELNNTKIGNTYISCSSSFGNKPNPKANLMVKSIDLNVTQQQLEESFSQFGDILSCILKQYPDGKSRGFGYVQFKNEDQANVAIAQNAQLELNGKKVEIVLHARREDRVDAERNFLNLFVQQLPEGTDDVKLMAMFAEFGDIQSAHVNRDANSETLQSKGFVSYKQPESARAALDAMHHKQMEGGAYLLVQRHISRRENEVATGDTIQSSMRKTYESNLFVKNIPSEVSSEEIQRHFEQIGAVISIKLRQGKHYNPSAAYQQYFVLYKDIEHAKRAIQAFDQSTPFGRRPLSVQFWMPTQELQQQREQQSFNEVQQYFLRSMLAGGQQNNLNGMNGQQQYGGRPQNGYHNQQYRNQGPPRQGGRFNGGRGGNRNNMRQGQGQEGYQPATNQMSGDQMQSQMGQQPQFQQKQNEQMTSQVDVQRLMAMDPTERRQEIGNNIYHSIQQMYGDAAGKITGMLLDNEKVVDPIQLVSDVSYLQQKAMEAMQLLEQTSQQQQPAQQ